MENNFIDKMFSYKEVPETDDDIPNCAPLDYICHKFEEEVDFSNYIKIRADLPCTYRDRLYKAKPKLVFTLNDVLTYLKKCRIDNYISDWVLIEEVTDDGKEHIHGIIKLYENDVTGVRVTHQDLLKHRANNFKHVYNAFSLGIIDSQDFLINVIKYMCKGKEKGDVSSLAHTYSDFFNLQDRKYFNYMFYKDKELGSIKKNSFKKNKNQNLGYIYLEYMNEANPQSIRHGLDLTMKFYCNQTKCFNHDVIVKNMCLYLGTKKSDFPQWRQSFLNCCENKLTKEI